MALYPLADWIVEALEDQGLTVKKVEGWKTRGYGPYTYDPVGPVMFHHTASGKDSGNAPSLHTVTNGRADLPGPLCQILVPRKPHLTVYVVAAGYANHAGAGGPFKTVPKDSGNKYIVGVEVENNGIGEPWSADLLDTCARVFAAVLLHQKRDESWLLGHKEWTTRKIDPRTGMEQARRDADAIMEGDDVDEKRVREIVREELNLEKDTEADTIHGMGDAANVLSGISSTPDYKRPTKGIRGQVFDYLKGLVAPGGGPHSHEPAEIPHDHEEGKSGPPTPLAG